MKIAYCSPFNPLNSGISDFSEELVLELVKHIEVDLFVDKIVPTNKDIIKNFKIFDLKKLESDDVRKQYDTIIYQVGNNAEFHEKIVGVFLKYGGILELHDISLHNYLAASTLEKGDVNKYLEVMSYCHGKRGEEQANLFLQGKIMPLWETRSFEFTVNKHLVDKASGIIVHSDMAKQMVKGVNPIAKVISIPLHADDIVDDPENYKIFCRTELGIDLDVLVMGSFGLATKEKRIVETIRALGIFKKRTNLKFYYYIVGRVAGIEAALKKEIIEQNLTENVIITSFITMEQFKLYMGAVDFGINLRYPTQGESSATVYRALGMGKPLIVTDIGSFKELDSEIARRVRYDSHEVDDIFKAIVSLSQDKAALQVSCNKAVAFAKENLDLKLNAVKYVNYFNDINDGLFIDDYIDDLINKLVELKCTDDKYLEHIARNLQFTTDKGVNSEKCAGKVLFSH